MNPNRLAAIATKEIIHIRRDVRSLIIVVLMPAILVLLFGYGVSLDLKHLPVYVFDRNGTQASQDLLKRFQSSNYFRIAKVANSYPELAQAIDSGKATLAIIIPHDFSERLHDGGPVEIQAIVDASDDNTANLAVGYAQGVLQGYSSDLQVEWRERRGLPRQFVPLSTEVRTWFNEDLESSAFIVPGVLALVMTVIGAFLTSLTVAREWERGTMEQLISTPVTALEIMLGKLLPYFVIGMVDVGLSTALAVYWFRIPFRGTIATLFLSSALFLIVMLLLGFFISVIAKTQLAASQIALIVTFLPAFLLSGFLFAIEQMPVFIQYVTRVLPARYYVSALKNIFLKGTPVEMLYADLLPLAVFALVLVLLATRAFKKKLA
ncbi:MAG: ABC transporter permease [Acidobacteriia bacterium]|nr:ABC transporter permease [Terriglobia bacterium]